MPPSMAPGVAEDVRQERAVRVLAPGLDDDVDARQLVDRLGDDPGDLLGHVLRDPDGIEAGTRGAVERGQDLGRLHLQERAEALGDVLALAERQVGRDDLDRPRRDVADEQRGPCGRRSGHAARGSPPRSCDSPRPARRRPGHGRSGGRRGASPRTPKISTITMPKVRNRIGRRSRSRCGASSSSFTRRPARRHAGGPRSRPRAARRRRRGRCRTRSTAGSIRPRRVDSGAVVRAVVVRRISIE